MLPPEVIALVAEWILKKLGMELWGWIHECKACAQAKRDSNAQMELKDQDPKA